MQQHCTPVIVRSLNELLLLQEDRREFDEKVALEYRAECSDQHSEYTGLMVTELSNLDFNDRVDEIWFDYGILIAVVNELGADYTMNFMWPRGYAETVNAGFEGATEYLKRVVH